MTSLMPGFDKSFNAVMPALLSCGTMTTNLLRAKTWGMPVTNACLCSMSMFFKSALANTSAFAPLLSCVTKSCEPAKLNSTCAPGLAFSNSAPRSWNAFVSDAAAYTMSLPPTLGAAGVGDSAGVGAAQALNVRTAIVNTDTKNTRFISTLLIESFHASQLSSPFGRGAGDEGLVLNPHWQIGNLPHHSSRRGFKPIIAPQRLRLG